MQPKLGIIAGGGTLTRSLVRHCQDNDRAYCVVALQGHAVSAHLEGVTHLHWSRIGAVANIIDILKEEGVCEMVMIGPVKRPNLLTVVPDLRGLQFLWRAGLRAFGGDNSILSAIVEELEREGFRVLGVDSLLEDLITPSGVLTRVAPDTAAKSFIEIGLKAARKLGARDIGQAVVIQGEHILAKESHGGTNDLIYRAGVLARDKQNLILIKAKKPGQERRVDLPTIGLETVQIAIQRGFAGIAIEAGHSLLVDKDRAIAAADASNFFIIGV